MLQDQHYIQLSLKDAEVTEVYLICVYVCL